MNILQRGVLRQIKSLYFGVDYLQNALPNPIGVRCFRRGTAQLQQESTVPSKDFEQIMKERLLPLIPISERIRNWIDSIGFVGLEQRKLESRSIKLYQKTIENINYQDFFDIFNMPNTFNSWFLVTELHVWLLMVRAMSENTGETADGTFIRNSILNGMWMDINHRINGLRMDGLHIKQSNQAVQSYNLHFRMTLILYDEGLLGDDKILANALWLQFLESNCDDLAKIDLIVKYVRKTAQALDHTDSVSFFGDPKSSWLIPIKDIDIVAKK